MGARLGGLIARGLIGGAAAVIVVVATLLTWPWAGPGPTVDQQRVEDLQRLSHAIDAFRLRQHVLPAALKRLPVETAAPVHLYDPVTNRPYDYRPLGPLAYELCASFDSASPDERRLSWWHDAGRHCFSLEAREGTTAVSRPAPPPASTHSATPESVPPPERESAPPSRTEPAPPPGTEPAAPPGSEPAPPSGGEPAAPPGGEPAAQRTGAGGFAHHERSRQTTQVGAGSSDRIW